MKRLVLFVLIWNIQKISAQNIEYVIPSSIDDLPGSDVVMPATNLTPSGKDYSNTISSGKTIDELIEKIQRLNQNAENNLNRYNESIENVNETNNENSVSDFNEQLNSPDTFTIENNIKLFDEQPISYGSNIDRYLNSPCFQTLGYNPNNPDIEVQYQECEKSKTFFTKNFGVIFFQV